MATKVKVCGPCGWHESHCQALPQGSQCCVQCQHGGCHAARTGEGYWTCDVPGGCADCRRLAREADDTEQLQTWNTERGGAEMAAAKERMDPGFAVFNQHVNDAGDRASREFVAQFGQEKFDQKIKPFIDKGVMSIFDQKPTKWTLAWVTLVTAYVNEDRA